MAAPARFRNALILGFCLAAALWLLRGNLFTRPELPTTLAPVVGLRWQDLTKDQHEALAPLQVEWADMPLERRQKWLGVAQRFAALTPQEQVRIQERMRKWTELSASEREKARLQYKKLRTVPSDQRRDLELLWREYEALSSEQKERLQATSVTVSRASSPSARPVRSAAAPTIVLPKAVVLAPAGVVRPTPAVPVPAPEPAPDFGQLQERLDPDLLPRAEVSR